jgi:anti-anti-sigma factor
MAAEPNWQLLAEKQADGARVYFSRPGIYLDETNTHCLGELLPQQVKEVGKGQLHLDLANVNYLTSSTLSVLLVAHKELHEAGGSLILDNVTPPIYEIFAITSLTRLFQVNPAAVPSPA